MTAPISNGPTTTRLHHYAGHYLVQFPRLVAVGSRRGVSESRVSRNFARNSLDGVPSFEGRSLGLQRFLASLKNDRWKLRAKFVWRGVLVARVSLDVRVNP